MTKVKKPYANHTKESCLSCKGGHDKETVEFSPDWFTYMCIECMHEHAKKWGYEFV